MPPRVPFELVLPFIGAGGEPISMRGIVRSHGLAALPPNDVSADGRTLRTTIAVSGGRARTLVISEPRPGELSIAAVSPRPNAREEGEIIAAVRTMFVLDENLEPFYALASRHLEYAFVMDRGGIGRILRGQTAFEDVVRTICTTNCAWAATERMNLALVEHLGTPAPGAPAHGWEGRAFPSPRAMAEAPESFYRDIARAGYRGAYLRTLARAVAAGELDLEAWRASSRTDLPDAELEARLLALPGVGPYAAAHVMMLFGRSSRLILDSWTRPRYASLRGKKQIADVTIRRHFKHFGEHAGLAFWLYLWRDRHLDEPS